MASRHLSRALVLQTLFECDLSSSLNPERTKVVLARNAGEFSLGRSDVAFAEDLLAGVLSKQDEIDAVIVKAAPQWPLEKIAPIDRNVLRIGLYELLFGDRTAVPPKVALNEAIEIGKSFGGEQSGKFVNGVLGAVYREIGEPQKNDAPKAEEVRKELLGGAVVVCGAGEDISVALVHDAFHRWTLPKTKCAEGELSKSAAERAIRDELGIEAEIIDALDQHTYTAREPGVGPVERTVAYFLARADTLGPLTCKVCEGITDVQWYAQGALKDLPIYEDLRPILAAGILRAQGKNNDV